MTLQTIDGVLVDWTTSIEPYKPSRDVKSNKKCPPNRFDSGLHPARGFRLLPDILMVLLRGVSGLIFRIRIRLGMTYLAHLLHLYDGLRGAYLKPTCYRPSRVARVDHVGQD